MTTSLFDAGHDALRDSVTRFATERISPEAARWDAAGALPEEVWQEAMRLGYLAAHLPADAGGGGGGLLDALVVAEALGAAGSAAFWSLLDVAHGALPLLLAAEPRTAARRAADAALQAQRRTAWVPAQAIRVDGCGSAVRLTGTARWVVGAATAGAAVVGLRGGGLALVDTAAEGWRATEPEPSLGLRAAGLADVHLESVPGTVLDLLPEAVRAARRHHRLLCAAAAVAGSWALWEQTRAYARDREAFGRPIGRFQVNRHALADAATALTAARAAIHDAVWAAGAQDPPPRRTASAAAAIRFAERTCADVADRCLQLHGGYGYSMEFAVQRVWRDDVSAPLIAAAAAERD